MSDSGTGEKTEEPTPQKLRQAREKGQVSRVRMPSKLFYLSVFFSVLALTIGTMKH